MHLFNSGTLSTALGMFGFYLVTTGADTDLIAEHTMGLIESRRFLYFSFVTPASHQFCTHIDS